MLERLNARTVGTAVALLLVVATLLTFRSEPDLRTASAHFSRAVSIYKGSEVRILGVPVGSVTAVVPEGNSVRVDMEYDSQYKVPANAKAVIVTPTLVADRFVQLTPAYDKGALLKDGATIAVQDTGTPVELDRIYASLKTLSNALGPSGANKDGSLGDLLAAGSRTLDGEGARGNRMINDLSQAAQTFGDGSGALFDTVSQLSEFTTVLADNDQVVSSFIRDLSGVSSQLSDERTELRAVLAALADAVGTVQSFVKDNRNALSTDLKQLTSVVGTVAKERDSLALALEKGPLGAGNLALAFDNPTGSIGGRIIVGPNADDTDGALCAIVQESNQIPKAQRDLACKIFEGVLERLPNNQIPPSSEGQGDSPLGGVTGQLPKGSGVGGSTPQRSLQGLLGGTS